MSQGDFWDKFKQRVREVSTAAADFTEEKTLIGKLKFELLNLKRKIDRLHREIGVRVSELSHIDPRPQPFEDEEITRLLEEIKDQDRLVELKKEEINKVADHFRAKSEARQAEQAAERKAEKEAAEKKAAKEAAAAKAKPEPEPKPKTKPRGRPKGSTATKKKTTTTDKADAKPKKKTSAKKAATVKEKSVKADKTEEADDKKE